MVGPEPVHHRPVLYKEILNALKPSSGRCYIDGTLGAGGHAWGILQASSPDGLLLGLDLDPQALELARKHLAEFGSRAIIVQASYAGLDGQIRVLGWKGVAGILLDLGLSSMQLDTPERGFSFQADAPLDMRFDPHNPLRAHDLVNNLPEEELAKLIFRYGEEPHARQIARAIVQARPVHTTQALAQVILGVPGAARSRKPAGGRRTEAPRRHPATRTFQALRIAVNGELETLETALPIAVEALVEGGRLVVISYHSLEDRIVKQFFRRESRDCLCPPQQPVCTCGHRATLVEVTRRPVVPQPEEVAQNPRSRSARLRVVERINAASAVGVRETGT
jgi:16S rRNA (cytosine1402-N4)-methyltransferase